MKKLAIYLCVLCALCGSVFADTHTSNGTGGGVFSAAGTWAGGLGVPVDTDAFVIAAGDTVTFDQDTSAYAGFAASTINATGTLIASTTAGAYILKMNGDLNVNGTLQAGTSVAVPYPSTCTFTINFSNTSNSIERGTTGAIYLYCTQPTNKYITATNAEAIGAGTEAPDSPIEVNTNVSADWVAGQKVAIVDTVPTTACDTELRTLGALAADHIHFTAGLTNAKSANALIVLITRNIRIINVAASGNAINYNSGVTSSTDYIGAEIYNCYRGISLGVGFEFAGTTVLLTTSGIVCNSSKNITISGMAIGQGSGNAYGLYQCQDVSISGLLAGWVSGQSLCNNISISGKIFGNVAGVSTSTAIVITSTGTVQYNGYGLNICAPVVSYGTFSNNNRAIYRCSELVLSCSFSSSTSGDLSECTTGRAFNTTFGSGTEFENYNTYVRHQSNYMESFDHDGNINAYKAWYRGGIVTSESTDLPTGYSYRYDHEVESATYPCFRQYAATVLPGTAIEVSAVIRNTDGINVSATSPIDLRPRLEIIDVFADPLVDSTQTALDSDAIAISDGSDIADPQWQAVDVIWANTGDSPRQVYVRIICYSHDASTHTIDEAWSVADYQDQVNEILQRVKRISATSE